MGTQVAHFSNAIPQGTIPESYQEQQMDFGRTFGVGASLHVSTHDVMSEFVSLLKDNPKVWAVAANEDRSGITVWIYVDSSDRKDRLPVYRAAWDLMGSFPDVAFDFNAILAPAGSETLESSDFTFLYRR